MVSHLLDVDVDSKYSWQFSNLAKDKKGKFSNALDILPNLKIKGLLFLMFPIYTLDRYLDNLPC
ncbi:MAG: hypothetical protein SWX82_09125 [Cyanobacteriota bacterium]|nr:hypothetical protein [Cyanobacteriota bacterium]